MARKAREQRRLLETSFTREKAGVGNWRVRQESSAVCSRQALRAKKQEWENGA